MNLLAFDSAQAACSAAVLRDGAIAARRFERMARGHAEALMPMIVAVLAEARLAFAALDAIAVTVGPGSYTGIRVGLAAAKGIALARGIPLIGVTTLDAVAHANQCGRPLYVALETKRADLYAQPFDARLRPLGPAAAIAPELAAAQVPRGALIAGDGAQRLKPHLAARADVMFAGSDGIVDAAVVAAIGAARGAAAGPVVPLYLRPPDVTLPATP